MNTDLAIHRDQLRSALREFFDVEDGSLFEGLESDLDFVSLTAGETLFREGDAPDAVWFVVSGRLRAVHDREETTDVVGEIARGETVGELGLITGEPRSATILAVRSSLVARMSRGTFERVITGRPQASIAVMRTIIERFRRSERARRARPRPVTLCMAPISEGVDAIAIAQGVATILREQGRHVRVLSGGDLAAFSERERAEAAESGGAIGGWLDAAEADSSTVILIADRDATPWSQSCLARADEIVLIAAAETEPRISGLEAYCLNDEAAEFAPVQTLVLLHGSEVQSPRTTAAWLDRRPVSRHVHVRPQLARDMRRLARILSGRAVGLVLSGGGARGFAHIGIMNALAEAGIEPDIVGGTSIGSIMAAWRAMDVSGPDLVGVGRRAFLEGGGPTSDYNLLPLVSLIKGVRTRRLTERAVYELAGSDIDIEDTWLNYFCVAGNYSTSAETVFRRGPLVKSVLASYAIPGALPPVALNGHLYVDGGTVNNLPVDVMERMGVGTIIAVDLLPDEIRTVGFEMIPGTAALLLDRFRPAARRRYRLPSLPEMLLTAGYLQSNGRQREMRERADICFRPKLERVRPLQWRKYDEVVARGYESAVAHLATLPPERIESCR